VVTVEPGVYFIPGLIDKWRGEGMHSEFLDYDAIDSLRGLGGIRIEDDVLVTVDGHRVLGPPVPKTVAEVEAVLAG
jgi:Xaa-Pro aminopeptidase